MQLLGLARRVERAARRDALLDRFMPDFDIVERHAIRVDASPDVTYDAASRVDLRESRLVRAIFRGREIMMRSHPPPAGRSRGLIADARAMGWGVLAEESGRQIVMGAVVQPWEADVIFRSKPPETFLAFADPGYVKIAWTIRADPDGPGSVARTETRAVATNPEARTRFRRYWRRVWPGTVLIRYVLLRLVKRDAEKASSAF